MIPKDQFQQNTKSRLNIHNLYTDKSISSTDFEIKNDWYKDTILTKKNQSKSNLK